MLLLDCQEMTLADFRQLAVYQGAVERGEIVDDEWAGAREEAPQ
jgi:hypothetical protein